MMMRKILSAKKGGYLLSHRLFPEEHKGCRKRARGTGELLHIDPHILKDSKIMEWIDYKKTYDQEKLEHSEKR